MGGFRSGGIGRPGRPGRVVRSWGVSLLAGLLGTILAAEGARAQGPGRNASQFTPDSSDDAERSLRNAAAHVRQGQWSEAIDIYQRVIERYGEKVAKLPKNEPGGDATGEFTLYVDDRAFCHRCLAQLPPEARQIYRNRVDSLAERWYRQGAARRDMSRLRRVVEEAFCSSWGDDALELLGDLAFQEGRFGEALGMYGHLVADRPDDPHVLIYPDPSVDLAAVAAKKWLCRAAEEGPPTPADLEAYARRYPGAAGELAGRKGTYAEILAQSLASDHLEPPGHPDGRWPTFAGSLKRTRVVPGPIDVGQIQWRVDLEKIATERIPTGFGSARNALSEPQKLLAFHPIVLGDQVVVGDGSRVVAYGLSDRPGNIDGGETGLVSPAWKFDPENGAVPQASRRFATIPRHTLTAVGHRIYARMGVMNAAYRPAIRMRAGFPISETGNSSIVALDWNTQGKLLWEVKSTSLELPHRPRSPRSVNFEGTPVADERNVCVAVTDRSAETLTYVACFDAETGSKRWIRYLGTARPEIEQFPGFGMPMNLGGSLTGDYHHRLLSLDGPTLYYLTNLGALAALDVETGATRWVATYPRQDSNQIIHGSDRDLNPALVHDGRVIVAPSDANAMFAFDAATGRLLWKTEPISDDVKLAHVLGVAKGRLVATGDRVLIFDVRNGKLLSAWPDSGKKSLQSYGRGLLAGDLIYWPTVSEIQVLDQQTGLLTEPPIRLRETFHTSGGNLVAGDGYLIVAQSDGMVVFCQNSRLIQRYRDEIVRAPDRASNYYRLARAAEATGREEMALDSFRRSIEKAQPNEMIDGIPLAGAARDRVFRLLMRLAGRSRHDHHWEEAIGRIRSAAGFAHTEPDRLESRLLLADILLDASRPRDAVDAFEQVLIDERLRGLPVAASDGHRTIRADLMVTDRLGLIVRLHGRDAYDAFDRQAKELYQRGKTERDVHVLREVCRDYPVALVVPDALEELGALYESSGRLSEAAHTYKRLLTLADDDARRARAIWSLARVYDARKLFVAAQDAYLQLVERFPKVRLDRGEGPTVAERVGEKLAGPPYASLVADRPQPPIPLPMIRRWQRESPADRSVRAVGIEGVVPSREAGGRIALTRRESLRLLDPSDGSERWTAELGSRAVWAGYLADKLIAATPLQIVALDLNQGTVQWRFGLDRSDKDAARPDPFADAGDPGDERPERPSRLLHEFRLVKDRVFCLRGASELIALDGDTGAVDWSFSAPPGEINSNLWIGSDRVVLQVNRPNQLLVLQTEDGKPVARTALAEGERLERPPLPVDDDSVLVVLDPRTVKKYDLNHGQTVWEYRESEDLPVNGPPRLFGDAERVLVLHEGRTLIRLDPATGSKRWSCLLGTEDLGQHAGAVAFDDRRFYCVYHGWRSIVTLRAVSLADGSPIWAREWAGSDDSWWSIALSANHVIAYPIHTGLADGAEMETIPVIVRRRENGAMVQRFLFPANFAEPPPRTERAGPRSETPRDLVTLKIDPVGALLATPRGVWGLGPN